MIDKSEMWMRPDDWKQYEAYAKGALRRRFPTALVRANVYLPGKLSGVRRQIDLLVDSTPAIAVDCKCYKRKVDVKHVEAFLGMLQDIDFRCGIMVTTQGYTKAALKRAEGVSWQVDLQIVFPRRLSEYQYTAAPLIWRDQLGIFLDCPPGWVADNAMTHTPDTFLVAMYPIGHTLDSAAHLSSFLYGNIIHKEGVPPSIEASADRYEANILASSPGSQFEREHLEITDEKGKTRPALFRSALITTMNFGAEHALYVDYGDWVLLLVGLSAPGEADEMKGRLLDVARRSFTMRVVDKRNPSSWNQRPRKVIWRDQNILAQSDLTIEA